MKIVSIKYFYNDLIQSICVGGRMDNCTKHSKGFIHEENQNKNGRKECSSKFHAFKSHFK